MKDFHIKVAVKGLLSFFLTYLAGQFDAVVGQQVQTLLDFDEKLHLL